MNAGASRKELFLEEQASYAMQVPAALFSSSLLLLTLWKRPPAFLRLPYVDDPVGIMSHASLSTFPPAQEKLVLVFCLVFAVLHAVVYVLLHRLALTRIQARLSQGAGFSSEALRHIQAPNLLWIPGLWMAAMEETVNPFFPVLFLFCVPALEALIAGMYLRDPSRARGTLTGGVSHAVVLLAFFAVASGFDYAAKAAGWSPFSGIAAAMDTTVWTAPGAFRACLLLVVPVAGWALVHLAAFHLGAASSPERWRSLFCRALAPFPALWLLICTDAGLRGILEYAALLSAVAALLFVAGMRSARWVTPVSLERQSARLLDYWMLPLLVVIARFALDPLRNVYSKVPDSLLYQNNWYFFAEFGQFLEWVDRIREGQLLGRDFFCLYGPYRLYFYQFFMSLFDYTYASFLLSVSVLGVIGTLGLYLALRATLRSRVWVVLLLFPWPDFRGGLGLLGLAALVLFLRSHRLRFAALGGAISGFVFLFSQEMGIVQAVTSTLAISLTLFSIRRPAFTAKALLGYWGGWVLAAAPYFVYAGLHGALDDLLVNTLGYVRDSSYGYAFSFFPNLSGDLPPKQHGMHVLHGLVNVVSEDSNFRCYLAPALMVTAAVTLLLQFWHRRFRFSTDFVVLSALLVFNALLFQLVITRSDSGHLTPTLGATVVLFGFLAERVWRFRIILMRRGVAAPAYGVLAGAVAVLWILGGGLDRSAALAVRAHQNISGIAPKSTAQPPKPTSDTVNFEALRDYVQERTSPDDFVLAVPNMAALYHVVGRRNPIRFGNLACMVTNEHREEAAAMLRARPPKLVLYSTSKSNRQDQFPDGAQLDGVLRIVEENYRMDRMFGDIAVLRPLEEPRPDFKTLEPVAEWHFDGDAGGWSGQQRMTLSAEHGELVCRTTERNAHVWGPPVGIAAVDGVEIRLKANHAGFAYIMWQTADDKNPDEWARMRAFPVAAGDAWQTIRLDLRFYNECGPEIGGFRRLRVGFGSKGAEYRIDSVRLLSEPQESPQPPVPETGS